MEKNKPSNGPERLVTLAGAFGRIVRLVSFKRRCAYCVRAEFAVATFLIIKSINVVLFGLFVLVLVKRLVLPDF